MCTHIELTAGPGIGPVLSTGAAIAGGCWPWLVASAPRLGKGAVASASSSAGPVAPSYRPTAGMLPIQGQAWGPGPPAPAGALRWDWGLGAGDTERGLAGIAVRLCPVLQQGWSLCVCRLGCVG
jgi:hypothetical protein